MCLIDLKEMPKKSGNTMSQMYHATYRPYLASILKWGLGGAPVLPPKNYEDSEDGVVYLATTPDIALSYAETAEGVPQEWLDDIVMLRVDLRQLNLSALGYDKNVRTDEDTPMETLEYRGLIPAHALSIAP